MYYHFKSILRAIIVVCLVIMFYSTQMFENDKDEKIAIDSKMWDADATHEIEHIQLVPKNTEFDETLIHEDIENVPEEISRNIPSRKNAPIKQPINASKPILVETVEMNQSKQDLTWINHVRLNAMCSETN